MGGPPIDPSRANSLSLPHIASTLAPMGRLKYRSRVEPIEMSNQSLNSNCLLLSLVLCTCLSTGKVCAKKLTASPLPHESEVTAELAPQQVVPALSRFHPSNDLRDQERLKATDQAKAAQIAEAEQKRALAQEALKAKQQLQASIAANNRAVQLGRQGRWSEAIAEHEKAVQLDPSDKQFKINLSAARTVFGQQLLGQGDAQSACHLFRQALSIAPDNALAARKLVESIKKLGLDPSNAEIRLNLGDQIAGTGDLASAQVEYQIALNLENSARTNQKMGDFALSCGQADGASAWYKQALVKDPDYGPAYRQLGFIALGQGDLTLAAAHFRKALIADPKDASAGEALTELWRKQVAANPKVAENHLGLACALQLTLDFSGAEGEYQRVAAIDPKNPSLQAGRASLNKAYQHAQAQRHKLAATTLYGQNLRKEALTEISQAVMIEPRNALYQFLLGECLESIGDYQGAHQAYLTCVLIDPENNKEAAARMKQMQMSGSAHSTDNNSVISSNGLTMQSGNQSTASATNIMTPGNPQSESKNLDHIVNAAQAAPKDMFESSNSNQSDNTFQSTFNEKDTLKKVEEAEGHRDYQSAANLLSTILPAQLQNHELHHRLAVDLLSAGAVSEAISEFRIASALSPNKKDYSDDLARALAIHKRSLMECSAGAAETVKDLGNREQSVGEQK